MDIWKSNLQSNFWKWPGLGVCIILKQYNHNVLNVPETRNSSEHASVKGNYKGAVPQYIYLPPLTFWEWQHNFCMHVCCYSMLHSMWLDWVHTQKRCTCSEGGLCRCCGYEATSYANRWLIYMVTWIPHDSILKVLYLDIPPSDMLWLATLNCV